MAGFSLDINRRSEVLGLRWNAVDFERKTIEVNHKVVKVKINGKMGIHQTNDLKTKASYRDFALEGEVLEFLTQLKQKQDENRILMGNSYIQEFNGYICVNEMGDLLKPDYVSDRFGKEIDRAGLKHICYHELRHSCGSLLLSLGYSMKAVQSYLGHANYLTTANLYARVEKNKVRDMSNGISDALSG